MKPLILSTENSAYFAKLIGAGIPSSKTVSTTRKRFGNGERYLKIDINDRDELLGRNVIIVGSGSSDTDADFDEVCRIGSAAVGYGASQALYLMPYFGYATMDRARNPGEIVTAKIMARQLSYLPQGDKRNCFFLFDLHNGGIKHFFEGNCLRFDLHGEEVLSAAFERLGLQNFMFASADMGRAETVEFFAERYKTPMAFVSKKRKFEATHIEAVVGDVRGRIVVIYDDMIRSAGTLIQATNAYLKRGALAVYVLTSHFGFNDAASIQCVIDSPIVKVIGTNSHPMSQHELVQGSDKFVVEDVSQPFAGACIKLNGGPR